MRVCSCMCACVTSLSLPPSSNGWPIDRALLYSIETLVIQWSGQIWTVLKRDSSMVLQQGDHPGPSAELHFWACQRGNLLGVHSQVGWSRVRSVCMLVFAQSKFFLLLLRSVFSQIMNPKVEQIMEILRRIKSSYYASFRDICLKVNQGSARGLVPITNTILYVSLFP